MRFYKTYNFIAVFAVIGFAGFLGAVIFWPDPQGANAMQMESSIPQTAASTQTSKEDNRLSAANFAADESISDEVHSIDSDSESLFTQNSLGEISPIEISSSDSGSSSNFTSVTGMDTESITRIIQSDSADTVASAVAADASSSSSASSVAAGSAGSSGTGSAGSSDTTSDSSGSSGTGGSGSSGAGSSDASGANGSNSSGTGGSGSPIVPQDEYAVLVLSAYERVLQSEYAITGESSAEIFCAKNETESFQIVVANKSFNNTLPDIEITVSQWQPSGSANNRPQITLYREHYVKTTVPSWGLPADTPIGWYPNALIPFVDPYTNRPILSAKYLANHQSVPSRTSQGYWADVKVGANVPAGQYTCSVLVTSADSLIAEIPVTLNVWNFTLPTQRAWTAWFSMLANLDLIYGLQENTGDDYELLMSRHQDMLYEHGVYPTLQIWPPLNKKGNVDFYTKYCYYEGGYKSYETILQGFIKKYGSGVLRIPFYVIKDNFDKEGNNSVGAQILSDYHKFSLAHPEYGKYFYIIDEPYTVETANQVINIGKLINEGSLSSIKMLTNGDVYEDYYRYNHLSNYKTVAAAVEAASDIRSFYSRSQMQPFTTSESLDAIIRETVDDGRTAWACQTSKLDNDLLMNRIGTWRGYVLGITGQLEWRSIPSDPALNPWIDPVNYKASAPMSHSWNGYDQYVYPGTQTRVGISGPGGPVASMMLKVFRSSVEDYAYFKLAESLTDRKTVVDIVSPLAPDFKTCKDSAEYEAVRRAIAELILSKMN